MSTLGSILNTARSAIFANQAAIRVSSQNIANAETEGYSRKRADLLQAPVEQTVYGRIGSGVLIDGISRVRDPLLDRAFRREAGKAAGYEMRQNLVGQIEEVFGEPSETGLSATLDAFWRSWSDLANQPTSDVARKLVRLSGERLATTLQDFTGRLDELAEASRVRLESMVGDVNRIARQLADLNRGIQIARAAGDPAPDLLDQRDQLVDKLSQFGGVRVVDRRDGTVGVLFEDATLVDGDTAKTLAFSGNPPVVKIGTSTLSFDGAPGALGEVVGVLTKDIAQVQAGLDALAAGVIAKVNDLHRQGFTQAGATGIDFFDPSPANATARNIRLSAAVKADESMIVASSQPGADGDNKIALRMIDLRDDGTVMAGGTQTFQAFFRGIVTDVASRVHEAENSVGVYKTLAAQVDTRRQSVSGVSTDEELVHLMNHQQAYSAAAKVLGTVSEMMDEILRLF